MKKLTTLLLALCAVALTGCEPLTKEQRDEQIASDITEFSYKGHNYLLYERRYCKGGVAGLVHDPDCPCHKTNSER